MLRLGRDTALHEGTLRSMDRNESQRKVNMRIESSVARGTYANATVVTKGRHEVVLDFVAALPHHAPQIVSRVVLSHAQAEALAGTLRRTMDAPLGPSGAVRGPDHDPN